MVALRTIRDNFSECYKRLGGFWVYNMVTGRYEGADEKTAYSVLNELYRGKSSGSEVEYHYSARMSSGRRFGKNSLQGISRKIRHTIAGNLYYDLDIVNAHPTFLRRLCEILEFENVYLDEYVRDRDTVLERWIGTNVGWKTTEDKKREVHILRTRDDVKEYVLRVINGGGNGDTSSVEVNDFYRRHQVFLDMFYKNQDYRVYRDRAYNKQRSKGQHDNVKGSALNHYLCEVEDEVLSEMEGYLQEHQNEYGTLCFDGLMTYKRGVDDVNRLTQGMSEEVSRRMGYEIRIKNKEMDEGIDLSDLRTTREIKTTDEDYAMYIMEEIKDDYKYDQEQDNLWWYNRESALWERHPVSHLRLVITNILQPYILSSPDKKQVEEQLEWIKSDSFQGRMVRMCNDRLKARNHKKFIKEKFDAIEGLFPLQNNEVIELETGIVREREKTDYFTKTTSRKIVEVPDDIRSEILDYYAAMLKTTSATYRDSLMMRMAYIMTGCNNQKIIMVFLGKQNGGKSTFLDLHSRMMEGFACWGNDRIFIQQKNKACHDSELFSLIGSRMAMVSEASSSDHYNCVIMKKISGGDTVDIRGSRDKETVNERFQCVITLAMNEMPRFKDEAFADRLNCFHFCNVFKKDSAIVKRLHELRDHFFTVLTEYAKVFYDNEKILAPCEEITSFTKDLCEEQDSVKWWCGTQRFERGLPTDYIEKTELYQRYITDCTENMVKNRVGKIEFYKTFREHLGLDEDVKIKYRNDANVDVYIRGYRGWKEAADA